ncbi:MAG: lantibiotic protection ABC transporter ATP-binding subunit [Caloramator sp.]|nr:lantibiotic protection ABC transporter ATP-binding subunit [Caloramator sp.]
MRECVLEAKNITKYYGKHLILKDVSLKVPRGSIFGIVGPNGAGKTTFLKILSGITRQNSGEVIVFGERFNRRNLNKLGTLIEYPSIYSNLTAEENLIIHTLLMGIERDNIKKVLNIVGLENADKKIVSKFSLGMKQRLGIAIALLGDPEILILDEPTNGLDPIGIQEMRELILSFKERGITVIITSHILSEIEKIIDKIAIINLGEIRYVGDYNKDENLERLFIDVVKGDYNG